MREAFEEVMRRGGSQALSNAEQFFMKNDPVHLALRTIATRLDELQIPYAVADGMSLVAHGYDRTTQDVDVLVTPDGRKHIHATLDGLGCVPPFAGSKNLRDVATGVQIKFLVTGNFPGDGKPKPVPFPNPSDVGVVIDGIRYVRLESLIELKLASGMTNAGRLKDLADVQELIRALRLDRAWSSRLNPFVREKYGELWDAVRNDLSDEK